MKKTLTFCSVFFLLLLAGSAFAKNNTLGIYAVIDSVTFEPQGTQPNVVRISGVFIVPRPISSGEYLAPQRGYLYFRARPGMEDAARKEWNELRAAAGSGQVVAFGEYWVWAPPNPNNPSDPLRNTHRSLEVKVHSAQEVSPPELYPLPNSRGIVMHRNQSDPDFDKIAAQLRSAARH
jgi:hypothetical protein